MCVGVGVWGGVGVGVFVGSGAGGGPAPSNSAFYPSQVAEQNAMTAFFLWVQSFWKREPNQKIRQTENSDHSPWPAVTKSSPWVSPLPPSTD